MKTRLALMCAVGVIGAAMTCPVPARAAAAGSESAPTATDKLGRGLAGMVGGVLEFPGNMVQETDRRGAEGLPIGFAKGLGMIVARELAGVYEFVTAPVPLPRNYQPVLQPEYPWDYFRQDQRPAPRASDDGRRAADERDARF